MTKETHDVATRRLGEAEYVANFCDIHPPLDLKSAANESNRCHYCFDAPCITACPTHINIPGFIRKISTGNLKGAATEILSANIMGGTCARVCPVEILCEKACVRNHPDDKPVAIGLLQRYATDFLFAKKIQPFRRGKLSGKKVAVVGAGPAGLSCAHQLSQLGYDVVVFEAKNKAGGLNEYGIAAYKMTEDFARREVEFIQALGGIEIKTNHAVGKEVTLESLRKSYDAVFLGIGLQGNNPLGLDEMPGVLNATEFIAELRQAPDLSKLSVGRRVVVIGGGNTAIDIALQMKRLGAEEVTLVYRRAEANMGATEYERELARTNGVLIRTEARPVEIIGDSAGVTGVRFERTDGATVALPADQVFKAIGQKLLPKLLGAGAEILETRSGKILVDECRETTVKGIFAGGDCVGTGMDLTVRAVEDGKIAARAIHARLSGATGG